MATLTEKEFLEQKKKENTTQNNKEQIRTNLFKEIKSCLDLNTKIRKTIKADKKGADKQLKNCLTNYKYISDIYAKLNEIENESKEKVCHFVVSDELRNLMS